jgi:putative SOS response-associated peptidase YedK
VCGRFVSSSTPDELASYFAAELAPPADLAPNYNVAPTEDVLVVRHDGEARRLEAFRWGLVPPWAKDLASGAKMINARAETLTSKTVFRKALEQRRCLVPADGFYEWTKVPGHRKKQPWYIHRPDGEPYAFAGLWERWRAGAGQPWVLTCTIITGAANEAMAPLHDRMPIMLPPDRWEQWLDRSCSDVDGLARLLVPAPAELIAFHPVSTAVNRAGNGGPDAPDGGAGLVEPVATIDPDGTGVAVPGRGGA